MKHQIAAIALVGCTLNAPAFAGEMNFSVGLSYASGINDVVDYYEETMESEGYEVDASLFPLGVSHTGHYQFDNGLRLGYGVGPAFLIAGDVDYTEIPFQANVGYTFAPSASVSPYVFVGPTVHFIDGDYVTEDSASGAIFGAGIEFARNSAVSYVLEIAKDTTEVEFSNYSGYSSGYYYGGYYYNYNPINDSNKSIKSYDTVVSFRVMF